jgi:exopolysaccharide biosynthesis polyprenyl glycosylphosphotransferase
MKRSELFFAAILVPIDFVALLLAGATAYYLRMSEFIQSVRPAVFVLELPVADYMQIMVVVAVLVIAIFALNGLYAMRVTRRLYDEWVKIFSGVSIGMMGVIVFIFLSAELFQSRFILLMAYVLAIIMVTIGRWLVRKVQLSLLKRGFGVYRVVLVGNGRFAKHLQDLFKRKHKLGYRVVANIDIVSLEALEKVYSEYGIDEVIKTDPTLTEDDNLVLLEFCDRYKIDYKYIPDLYETYASHIRFRQIEGVPLMELLRTPLDGWGRVAKRIVDVLGSLFGLIFLAPLFLVVAMLIKLDSAGSVFYSQSRVGKNMKKFRFYKFRSMRCAFCTGDKFGGDKAAKFEDELRNKQNERSGPLFKMRHDPRITKVGKWLRRTRIDELPQLFNVLRGEMSLVGPRPHLPKEIEKYKKQHNKLFTIKPGMTGMAQVNGNAGLPFEQEAKLDIGYIEDWSLKLDVILLFKTLIILFTDRNAV